MSAVEFRSVSKSYGAVRLESGRTLIAHNADSDRKSVV